MILAVSVLLMVFIAINRQKQKWESHALRYQLIVDAAQLMGSSSNAQSALLCFRFSPCWCSRCSHVLLHARPLMGVTPGLNHSLRPFSGGVGLFLVRSRGFVIGLLETFATAFGMSEISVMLSYMESCFWFLIVRPTGILVGMWKRRCKQWRQILK